MNEHTILVLIYGLLIGSYIATMLYMIKVIRARKVVCAVMDDHVQKLAGNPDVLLEYLKACGIKVINRGLYK